MGSATAPVSRARKQLSPAKSQDEDGGDRRSIPWTSAVALAIAAGLVGAAVQVKDGNFHPAAIILLTLGFAAGLFALAGPPVRTVEAWGARGLAIVLAVVLAVQVVLLYSRPPVPMQAVPRIPFAVPVTAGAVLAAVLVAAALASGSPWVWAARVALPLLLVAYVLMGLWAMRALPYPMADMYVIQYESCEAVFRGDNPYAVTFDDLSHGTSPFASEGMIVNGRLNHGFVYPPLSLALVLPAYAFGDDVRYAHLVCIALAAALIAYARPGRLGALAAAALLLTPRGLFVLSQSWTEPLVLVLLAAVVFCACRWPRALSVALGLFFAVKQYTILAAPLTLLLLPWPLSLKRVWGLAWRSALTALIVTLPAVFVNVRAYYWSTAEVVRRMRPRPDSLGYPAALAAWRGVWLPASASLVAFAIVTAIALLHRRRRRRRTGPAGFAMAVAVAYFAFFAFNKQAFANYYFFVIGAACCAIGAMPERPGVTALAASAPAGAT